MKCNKLTHPPSSGHIRKIVTTIISLKELVALLLSPRRPEERLPAALPLAPLAGPAREVDLLQPEHVAGGLGGEHAQH